MGEQEMRSAPRRSPLGDFLLSTLSVRSADALAWTELLRIAGDSGLNVATVLAWAERAEGSGLIEQLPHPDSGERALRLTRAGKDVARGNRRRVERRASWTVPSEESL